MSAVWDRDAARKVLVVHHAKEYGWVDWEGLLDALEACVHPVDGVFLTREEAQRCASALQTDDDQWGLNDEQLALKKRLESAS